MQGEDTEGGTGRQEDYSKTIEQIYGCSEGGHGVGVREVDAEDRVKWRQLIDTVREEQMKVSF